MFRHLFVSVSLLLAAVSTASAAKPSLADICDPNKPETVTADACLLRNDPADEAAGEFADIAGVWSGIAARIEVIAEKRRTGEITQQEAAAQFLATIEQGNKQLEQWAAESSRRARVRSLTQGLNDPLDSFQSQSMFLEPSVWAPTTNPKP